MQTMNIFIKNLREKKGMRQIQFSKFLGITQSCLSKIERGKLKVSGEVMCKLLILFPKTTVKEMKKYGEVLNNGKS